MPSASVVRHAVQTFTVRADPDDARRVLDERGDHAHRAAANAREALTLSIEQVYTTIARPHPKPTAAVLEHGHDVAVRDRRRIERVVPENDELVPAVAIETVLGAKPHEAAPILDDG